MGVTRRLAYACAGLAMALGTFPTGCSTTRGRDVGGLMLIVAEDGPLSLDRLEIEIAANGQSLRKSDYRLPAEVTLPTTLAIASNGNPAAAAQISVVGWRAGVPLDRRDNLVEQIPTDRVAALKVVLSGRCTPQVFADGDVARSRCPGGETCDPRSGSCVSSRVDASSLPTYSPGDEHDAGTLEVPPDAAASDATVDAPSDGGLSCGSSEKRCADTCQSTFDPRYGCGSAACAPCSVDPNSTFTCGAGKACTLSGCGAGYKLCDGKCVATNDPTYGCTESSCNSAACPDAGAGTVLCQGGACVVGTCGPGTKACNGKCVPTDRNNGCESTSCGACAADQTCQGTPSTCTCVADNLTPCNGKACGTAINNCGQSIICPDTCQPQGKLCTASDAGTYACVCPSNAAAACTGKACGPALDNCGNWINCPNTCTGDQVCGVGGPNACGPPPSCNGQTGNGFDTCGPGQSESCCAATKVPGGAGFHRFGDPTFPSTVTSFVLDKYEVTAARFKVFVDAWVGAGFRPAAGAGKHVHLNGGSGLVVLNSKTPDYEEGWSKVWENNIPSDFPAWAAAMSCEGGANATYLSHPQRAINCVAWAEAYAFCIWDGGFLPSATEWDYAASGGTPERDHPWGTATLSPQYAVYCASGDGACPGTLPAVPGGVAALGGGRYGQLDLVGNLAEWTLDFHASAFPANTCVDCVEGSPTRPSPQLYARGGSFNDAPAKMRTDTQTSGGDALGSRHLTYGFRCARIP